MSDAKVCEIQLVFRRSVRSVAIGLLITVAAVALLVGFYSMIQPDPVGSAASILTLGALIAVIYSAALGIYAFIQYNVLERDLRRLKEKADYGESAKTIVHDIRGPLASLHAAVRNLPDDELKSEKAADVMELLRRSAARLQGVADDFLEAKRSAEDPELTNVHEVIEGLYQEYRARPDLAGMNFHYEPAPHALFVQGQGARLQRVVANIAKNALEAMEGKGSLSFTVELKRSMVLIHITDTGPGMGDTMAHAIMDGTSRSAGKLGGHGIGLRFVYNTLQSMGGNISVVSQVGKGTTMTLRLPRAIAGQANNVVPIHQEKSA